MHNLSATTLSAPSSHSPKSLISSPLISFHLFFLTIDNSWLAAQMAASPSLLPNLKFHDLVFGHDLGTGTFSVVR
jgi:hypothetical protein